jgi:hypothetical protein
VDIPSFIPANMLVAPSGAMHYKIISGGADIDFGNEVFTVDTNATAIFFHGILWQPLRLRTQTRLRQLAPNLYFSP